MNRKQRRILSAVVLPVAIVTAMSVTVGVAGAVGGGKASYSRTNGYAEVTVSPIVTVYAGIDAGAAGNQVRRNGTICDHGQWDNNTSC